MIGRSVRQEAERANPAPGENRLTSLNRATNEKQATEQATARPNEPKNEIHSYFHSPENEKLYRGTRNKSRAKNR